MPEQSDAAGAPSADRVDDFIGPGYVGREKATAVVSAFPQAPDRILDWLRASAESGDWRRFERFAGVAVHVARPGELAGILLSALTSGTRAGDTGRGPNEEDLVDMLGEIHSPEAVDALGSLLRERQESDGPYFPLCVKCIESLAEIDTPEAKEILREVATGAWPKPLQWHAAAELGIDEELGYDEDAMLGGA
ncbi:MULTISPECIES: HEAT repeat domain-containing protein [Streptomyces]